MSTIFAKNIKYCKYCSSLNEIIYEINEFDKTKYKELVKETGAITTSSVAPVPFTFGLSLAAFTYTNLKEQNTHSPKRFSLLVVNMFLPYFSMVIFRAGIKICLISASFNILFAAIICSCFLCLSLA